MSSAQSKHFRFFFFFINILSCLTYVDFLIGLQRLINGQLRRSEDIKIFEQAIIVHYGNKSLLLLEVK